MSESKGELIIGFRPDSAPGKIVYREPGSEMVFNEPHSVRYQIKPRGRSGDLLQDARSWYVATIMYGDGQEFVCYPESVIYEII